jgi:hypothetical protein
MGCIASLVEWGRYLDQVSAGNVEPDQPTHQH